MFWKIDPAFVLRECWVWKISKVPEVVWVGFWKIDPAFVLREWVFWKMKCE